MTNNKIKHDEPTYYIMLSKACQVQCVERHLEYYLPNIKPPRNSHQHSHKKLAMHNNDFYRHIEKSIQSAVNSLEKIEANFDDSRRPPDQEQPSSTENKRYPFIEQTRLITQIEGKDCNGDQCIDTLAEFHKKIQVQKALLRENNKRSLQKLSKSRLHRLKTDTSTEVQDIKCNKPLFGCLKSLLDNKLHDQLAEKKRTQKLNSDLKLQRIEHSFHKKSSQMHGSAFNLESQAKREQLGQKQQNPSRAEKLRNREQRRRRPTLQNLVAHCQ